MVRVADIAGRIDDDFRYGAHTVPASAFRHVLGTSPAISESLANPEIGVTPVPRTERHAATGKLKRFVPLLSPGPEPGAPGAGPGVAARSGSARRADNGP
jgi:hypothetical protein